MRTKKQKQAAWRNWFIMKTAGMITGINRIYWFCNNPQVREKACNANKAIKALQKAFINSKTEDWNG